VGFIAESLRMAISLILAGDRDVISAVVTSLSVAIWSVVFASIVGVPVGVAVALAKFPMKGAVRFFLNSLMAMPTVVIGLLVYGLLSRQGPLGSLGLIFTPGAIIVGQTILAIPVIANYTLSAIQGADEGILPTARTLGASNLQSLFQLGREVRFGLVAAIIAGFGRVVSEVGVAMMLGGNIRLYTRTMTTAIALETSKGDFSFGLALGLILMVVAFAVNLFLTVAQESHRA
jgi:tungstate transport system permease protein